MQFATGNNKLIHTEQGIVVPKRQIGTQRFTQLFFLLASSLWWLVRGTFFFFLLRLASQGILDLGVFVVTLRMYEAEGVALSQYWRNKKDPEGIEG